jgi:hypothetical protein
VATRGVGTRGRAMTEQEPAAMTVTTPATAVILNPALRMRPVTV